MAWHLGGCPCLFIALLLFRSMLIYNEYWFILVGFGAL